MWGDIAIAFLLAFITTFMTTPHTIKLAKKLGAIDLPKDERRINVRPMPRLRRNSCNNRIYCFDNIFVYDNGIRRKNRFFWRARIFEKDDRFFYGNAYNCNDLLH